MQPVDHPNVMLSIRDAARATGLSPKALRRRIERGTIPSVVVDGRRRIAATDLIRRGLLREQPDIEAPQIQSPDHGLEQRVLELEARVERLEAALARAAAGDTRIP